MKAQAVKNIMESFDRDARNAIIEYTIRVGHEGTPWTDDNLSSKKTLPGFQLLGVRSKTIQTLVKIILLGNLFNGLFMAMKFVAKTLHF
jgi:hypothetical protein